MCFCRVETNIFLYLFKVVLHLIYLVIYTDTFMLYAILKLLKIVIHTHAEGQRICPRSTITVACTCANKVKVGYARIRGQRPESVIVG